MKTPVKTRVTTLGGIAMAALVLGGLTVHAADTPGWAELAVQCSRETDRNSRLDCYDRIVGELRPGPGAQIHETQNESARPVEVQHEGHADHAEASVTSVAEFGVRGSALARDRETDERPADVAKRMIATITAIEQRPRGELVFTLDNGQVWAQKTANSWLPAKVGDSILIVAGSLGSHQLIASGRSSAVTRIR